MSEAREAALAHFGVKGMKWGVRKPEPTGRSGSAPRIKPSERNTSRATATRASGERHQADKGIPMSKKQRDAYDARVRAARRKAMIHVGSEVTKGVLITVGTVAVASVAGPYVAAGAGAIARTLTSNGIVSFPTTSRTFETVTIDRSGPAYSPGNPRADWKPSVGG